MYILATKGNRSLFEIAIFYFNQKRRGGVGVGTGRMEQTVTQQNLFFKSKVKQKTSRAKLNIAEGGC